MHTHIAILTNCEQEGAGNHNEQTINRPQTNIKYTTNKQPTNNQTGNQ